MNAVLASILRRISQRQVGFVHKRSGLQHVPSPFVGHVTVREPAQIVVNQRG
jgi:hypothetical protein